MMRRAARRAVRHPGRGTRHDETQLTFEFADESDTDVAADTPSEPAPSTQGALGLSAVERARSRAVRAGAARAASTRAVGGRTAVELPPGPGAPDAATTTAPGNVLDATAHLARAAEERRRAAPRLVPASPEPEADDWFELACELEEEAPERAREAYLQALAKHPQMADAHVNLGRLCAEHGDREHAEAHYRAAIECAPHDSIAWFNLGVLLEDLQREDEAMSAYQQAIDRDRRHADAHYNLGLLRDQRGRRREALNHLMKARRLYDAAERGR